MPQLLLCLYRKSLSQSMTVSRVGVGGMLQRDHKPFRYAVIKVIAFIVRKQLLIYKISVRETFIDFTCFCVVCIYVQAIC